MFVFVCVGVRVYRVIGAKNGRFALASIRDAVDVFSTSKIVVFV